jgi:hypothetical protein
VSNIPKLCDISNSVLVPSPIVVVYISPEPTECIVAILELDDNIFEKLSVIVLMVVASHSTSDAEYGLFASITVTATFLVPKLCVMEYVLSVPFPIVATYFSAVFSAVTGEDDVNFVPSNIKDSPKTAPCCIYFYRINKKSSGVYCGINR